MNTCFERTERGEYALEYHYDPEPPNPRQWDNLSVMLCAHKRYILGDKQINTERFSSWDDVHNYIRDELGGIEIMPLYLLDHSRLWLRAGKGFSDVDPQGWDWGQVGFVFTTQEQLDLLGIENIDPQHIRKSIIAEVEVYDKYLRGEAYGWVILKRERCNLGFDHDEVIESCWGYFDLNYMKKDAEAAFSRTTNAKRNRREV